MTLHAGYDSFTPGPGEWPDHVNCKVCNDVMVVERNCEGPTSYVMAIARSTRKHDFYYCNNSKQDWHQQAIKLLEEIKNTSSPRLAEAITLDLNDVLKSRKALSKGRHD